MQHGGEQNGTWMQETRTDWNFGEPLRQLNELESQLKYF